MSASALPTSIPSKSRFPFMLTVDVVAVSGETIMTGLCEFGNVLELYPPPTDIVPEFVIPDAPIVVSVDASIKLDV